MIARIHDVEGEQQSNHELHDHQHHDHVREQGNNLNQSAQANSSRAAPA
jgi:hypothetical protein